MAIVERLTANQRRARRLHDLRIDCIVGGADPDTVDMLDTAALFALRSRLILSHRLTR